MTEARDNSPPWVLFVDKGRPVAILPAMRVGEVANVEHLTMAEAQEIVSAANTLYNLLAKSRLKRLSGELQGMLDALTPRDQEKR